MIWLALAGAGGAGAVLRYLVDFGIARGVRPTGPLGIALVNISASLLAGLVVGLAAGATAPLIDDSTRFTLITGFLGGYSTLSTVSVDTVQLIRERRIGWALMNTLGMLALSILATLIGFWVAGAVN